MSVATLIVDFQADYPLDRWQVVDDGVMGGRSDGSFRLTEAGHARFSGEVSLENNGGFSSVRHRFSTQSVQAYTQIVIRLKGDGKRYQFRVKSQSRDYFSYIHYFETSGEWETIYIPLAEMYPTFRGRRLDLPHYPGEQMEEIALLISNKKAESFRLELDWIRLE